MGIHPFPMPSHTYDQDSNVVYGWVNALMEWKGMEWVKIKENTRV